MLRFLLSGSGWPYLLVVFIPYAVVLEIAQTALYAVVGVVVLHA
jgi:hypothetical protein